MHQKIKPDPKSQHLFLIKKFLLRDIKKYLITNEKEVLKIIAVEMIDNQTKISGEFFDDFLVDRILFYIPIDLKDLFDLCLEEPTIIADLARFTSSEPTLFMIIKDTVLFYLKDYVYRQMPELVGEIFLDDDKKRAEDLLEDGL